jgi:ribosomal subunit interface protein
MQIQVSGKHVDVGEALGSRISQELEDGIGKYFERGAQDAEVVVSKDGHGFKVDCWVRLASGQSLVTTGSGGDAHSAFTDSLDKLEKRVRRYKRRLKDHHIGPKGLSPEKTEMRRREVARSIVLRNPDDVEDDVFGDAGAPDEPPPVGMVIAETEAEIRTITVGRAVLELI